MRIGKSTDGAPVASTRRAPRGDFPALNDKAIRSVINNALRERAQATQTECGDYYKAELTRTKIAGDSEN